jgi:hypothetical protein
MQEQLSIAVRGEIFPEPRDEEVSKPYINRGMKLLYLKTFFMAGLWFPYDDFVGDMLTKFSL